MIGLRGRVASKLSEMQKYLEELEQLRPATEQEYLSNLQARRACEKTIELAIEAVISVASVIVSAQKLGIPQSEDDLITLLEQKKIISKHLALRLKAMKGFRNILVHKYLAIDDRKAYQLITEELDDFFKFEKEILKFMSRIQ